MQGVVAREEADKPEVLADLLRTGEVAAVREVNFTMMMEVVFLCERLAEANTINTRLGAEVAEDPGFWSSLLNGFRVRSWRCFLCFVNVHRNIQIPTSRFKIADSS